MSASEPIAARRPVFPVNLTAAFTFGPMDPAANWSPASSSGVTSPSFRCSGVPQFT